MKKVLLLSFFLSLIHYSLAQSYSFSAVAPSGQTLYYTIQSGGCVWLTNYNRVANPSGNIVIPEVVMNNGVSYDVIGIEASAFQNCSNIYSIEIPNSVIQIENSAFSGCSGLSHVSLGTSLIQIGGWAFANCPLPYIIIPSSVTSIGSYAFSATGVVYCNDANLRNWIGEWRAQSSCEYYNEGSLFYTNSSKTTLISGDYTLTSLSVPSTVENIGNYAFYGCSELDSVILGDNVLQVGNNAFNKCNNLSYLCVGRNVQNIGTNAFANCSISHLIYNADSCTHVEHCEIFGNTISTLNIGNYVRFIPDYAFENCLGITTVNLPNSVRMIGKNAFKGSGLVSISMGNNVTNIGDSSFQGCPFVSLTLPNAVTHIGNSAFRNCLSLESITLGNGIIAIGDDAFRGCIRLDTINLPASITSIGDAAFFDCDSLSTINYAGSINQWCGIDFSQSAFLTPYDLFINGARVDNLIIPNGVSEIKKYAFQKCRSLVSVSIPTSVAAIGTNAFASCYNISTVDFNAENCRQAQAIFSGFQNLTTINIGETVQYIPGGMFANCTGLVSINVPDAVTEIGSWAFNRCSNLTSATLGNGLESIGSDAFSQCTRLTSVSFGENIANIGDNAFLNCGIIGELVIPQGVISIGSNSFKDCFGITEITCLGRVAPTLGTSTFEGVDTNITVNIPCNTTNLYAGRWSYFHNFNEIPFLFNVASENLAQGTVGMLQEPTCDDPVAIVQATPRDGYRFDHWSDGSTQNPYTYTAMGSLTLTAYFASTTEGIDDIETDGIRVYVVDGRIIVEGAENETVRVFDLMGLCVGDNCSQRLTTGVYLVKVGSLPARKVVVIK